jgi:glyoxylase I family protein
MNEVVSPVRPHVHHVALTVSDLDASVAWYEEVFAVGYLMDAPHEGGTARILADPERTLMFALHRHDANQGEPFAETKTGLDHVGFLASIRR